MLEMTQDFSWQTNENGFCQRRYRTFYRQMEITVTRTLWNILYTQMETALPRTLNSVIQTWMVIAWRRTLRDIPSTNGNGYAKELIGHRIDINGNVFLFCFLKKDVIGHPRQLAIALPRTHRACHRLNEKHSTYKTCYRQMGMETYTRIAWLTWHAMHKYEWLCRGPYRTSYKHVVIALPGTS